MRKSPLARMSLKAIACALAVSLSGAAFAATALPQGDVNGDGIVNSSDARLVLDHLLERQALTGAALTRADANGDGKVTMADVVWINNHSVETTIYLPGNVPLVLVRVPAGSFQMGSPSTERSRWGDEGPVHTVNIGYAFYMGKYEVTQKQWYAIMGTNPASGSGVGDNYPVYYVSWNDCQSFITALNTHITNTGQGPATFRLPSEAEWEYACRAGTQTRFFFGDSLSVGDSGEDGPAGTLPGNRSDYMWYYFNYNTPTYGSKQVGTKLPNQFGLYDMSGNVWEWCQDWYHTDYTGGPTNGSVWDVQQSGYPYRVIRAGRWYGYASRCRSARRYNLDPDSRNGYLGFRLLRTQ